MINEKIKLLRKQNNLTQEDLANKLSVSRQSITKWESGIGVPDINNIEALAHIFNITIDELLSDEPVDARFNISRTEFDIFNTGNFDLNFGNVNSLDISLSDTEKVIVEIRTDLEIPTYKLAKVKFEQTKRTDLAILKIINEKKYTVGNDTIFTDAMAKKHLFIKVLLPKELARKIELKGNLISLNVHDIQVEKHIEFSGKADIITINRAKGHVELDTNSDLEINHDGSLNQLDINQWNSLSTLYLSKESKVNVCNKGRKTKVVFEGYENDSSSEFGVELNGYKSELTVRVQ